MLREKYNNEKLSVRRKRSLLKIMFSQSQMKENIDNYRPDRILRSRKKVKLKTTFTWITKIKKSPFYRGVALWNALPINMQHEQCRRT